MSEPTIHTRAQATALGLIQYFTGKSCPKGHIAFRHVSSGSCIQCLGERRATPEFKEKEKNNESRKAYLRNYCADPKNKLRIKNYTLFKAYGITLEQRDAMIKAQGNKCACCEIPFDSSQKSTSPHVDHNHSTGKIRAILCNHCNTAIGLLNEEPARFDQCKRYIRRHNAS